MTLPEWFKCNEHDPPRLVSAFEPLLSASAAGYSDFAGWPYGNSDSRNYCGTRTAAATVLARFHRLCMANSQCEFLESRISVSLP